MNKYNIGLTKCYMDTIECLLSKGERFKHFTISQAFTAWFPIIIHQPVYEVDVSLAPRPWVPHCSVADQALEVSP